MNQQGFPDSYKDSLRTLHAEHPTWIFQAQKTNLDWSDVIANESAVGANLVASSSLSSWKSTEYGAYDWTTGKWTGFDGATWVAASEEIVSYYMDPRNFLNDTYVFQFMTHKYDSAHQSKEGLQSLVEGTFLDADYVPSGGAEGPSGPGYAGGSGSSPSGPGANVSTEQPVGPGYSGNSGSTSVELTGPGSTGGPGTGNTTSSQTAQQASPSGSGEAVPQAPSGVQSSTGTTQDQVQAVAPGGSGSQGNVRLEGPAASISARELGILALPTVEYGPGMDASSITGDNTGAGSTSPVPTGQSYVDIIMKAAAQSGVNPYVIGAMILQEQGNGTSGSISGKTAGYEGYYNFFNIGAYQAGSMSAVTRGLWYASQSGNYGRPWNSIEKSIVGGAQYYGDNYVKQGQDTFYLKKFNVQGSNLYKHQYMTNVEGAAGEGAKLARAYTDAMKNETMVFKIPVYNNMPETACAKPTGTGSPNNKLSGLQVSGYALTPTFNMNTESYDIIVNPSVDSISVNAAVLDSKATVKGTGTIGLQSGNNTILVEVTAENGMVRTYKLNVVRQSDAPIVHAPTGPGSAPSSGSVAGPGTGIGPGYASGPGTSTSAGPGAGTVTTTPPETTAPEATTPEITTPSYSGSSDVQIGVAPGAQTGTSQVVTPGAGPGSQVTTTPPSTGTQAPAPSGTTQPQAPAVTAPPETQAPAATTPPETQAPAVTTPPETQAPAETQPQQSASLKKGDCNGDGKITILDMMLINKQILGQNVLSGAAKTAADLNGDGAITSADASALQKMIFGQ